MGVFGIIVKIREAILLTFYIEKNLIILSKPFHFCINIVVGRVMLCIKLVDYLIGELNIFKNYFNN